MKPNIKIANNILNVINLKKETKTNKYLFLINKYSKDEINIKNTLKSLNKLNKKRIYFISG